MCVFPFLRWFSIIKEPPIRIMMVKIALFVVTMVKVAKLGSGAPYAGSGRIKTVLGQIHLVTYYSSGGHRHHHSTPPNVGFQV
jgi:hypothetical protein